MEEAKAEEAEAEEAEAEGFEQFTEALGRVNPLSLLEEVNAASSHFILSPLHWLEV